MSPPSKILIDMEVLIRNKALTHLLWQEMSFTKAQLEMLILHCANSARNNFYIAFTNSFHIPFRIYRNLLEN